MITEIGIISGEILDLLETKSVPLSIREIKFALDEPMDLINMSIGWLIREGYVNVSVKNGEGFLSIPVENVSLQETDLLKASV